MRTAPKGAALWTPAGAYAPGPEMLRISASPAGGTGDLVRRNGLCSVGQPAKRPAGWPG